MFRADIAGVLIEIEADNTYMLGRFEPFFTQKRGRPDLKISLKSIDKIYRPKGQTTIDGGVEWAIGTDGNNSLSAFIGVDDCDRVISRLDANEGWSCATISYIKDNHHSERAATGILSEILFCSCIPFHRGIVMHAAAIEWKDRGIMFSAPGGTGKSTQANLWKTHMGARILNGDRPAVRLLDERPFVSGTPWSGKTPDFLNHSVPLTAIIVLEQAVENSIRTLRCHEAVERLMPRCFLTYCGRELMERAIDILGKIIEITPVYLLKCKPDKDAVELVYQYIG
ncbi:MAG: hypothetical protein N3I35_00805 [Clostridia bacterium]|nr:hypothetical protein [Clostridia bacterium]